MPSPFRPPPYPSAGAQLWRFGRTWEAFFPNWNPYLGQAARGEPLFQINVLSPTGDTSDEPSIRRARRPLSVIIFRFRPPR
jgi:hypothetical protein